MIPLQRSPVIRRHLKDSKLSRVASSKVFHWSSGASQVESLYAPGPPWVELHMLTPSKVSIDEMYIKTPMRRLKDVCFTSPRLRGSLGDYHFYNTDWLTPTRYWHLFYPIFSTLVVFQLFLSCFWEVKKCLRANDAISSLLMLVEKTWQCYKQKHPLEN